MLIKVIIKYKNLEFFLTTNKLTRRQAYCAEFLFDFNFVIYYIPGKENQKADSLIYWPKNFSFDNNNDY